MVRHFLNQKINQIFWYFSTVFTEENTDSSPTLDSLSYPHINDLHATTCTSGIISLLQDLKVHKACSPDGIFPRLLKKLL